MNRSSTRYASIVNFGKINKRGQQMTIRKAIAIALAVMILVLAFVMIREGVSFNTEKIKVYYGKVLVLLKPGGIQEFFSGCNKDDIGSYSGGRDFLEALGLEGKKVNLVICDTGVCSFEGEGLNLYRVRGDEVEKLQGDEWNKYEIIMSGNFNEIKRNWELYDAFYNLAKDEDMKDIYDSGISGSLSLYTKGGVDSSPIFATWENGEWDVATSFSKYGEGWEKAGEDKIVEKWWIFTSTITREVFYRGSDMDEALGKFVEQVWPRSLFRNDKEVYWKVSAPEKGDEYYLKSEEDSGQEIGTLINLASKYWPIVAAEHRNVYDIDANKLREGYDPWIRTEIKGSGSSAYGPAQLTKGLAENYLNSAAIKWTNKERDYLERFVDQGWKFLVFGGGKVDIEQIRSNAEKYKELGIDENSKYDSRFDYGGDGELTGEEDKLLYEIVVSKMLDEIYERNGEDKDKLWREWRFGIDDMDKEDKRYQEVFNAVWDVENSGKGWGDFDEIDSDMDVRNLRIEAAKTILKLEGEAQINPIDALELEHNVENKNLNIDGKNYALNIERQEDFPIVSFVYGGDKYGFAHDGNAAAVSNLLSNIRLKYFPVKLVKWDGSEWVDVGNEQYYRLPEKNFKEVFEASIAASYLKRVCR